MAEIEHQPTTLDRTYVCSLYTAVSLLQEMRKNVLLWNNAKRTLKSNDW